MNEKELLSKLHKSKNYDEYLGDYVKRYAMHYNTYASIQLGFHLYNIYDIVTSELYGEKGAPYFNELIGILKSNATEKDTKKAISDIKAFRQKMLDKVEDFVRYVDTLRIYEHLLGRVEYRFKDEINTPDAAFVESKIEQFLWADKNNAQLVNDKIKSIVSELPVRMTKQKFYDIIRDSLKVYKDSDVSSVDGFSYMVKHTASLYPELPKVSEVDGLGDLVEALRNTDYDNITKDEYEGIFAIFEEHIEELEQIVSMFMEIQECVNHYYVLLLMDGLANEESNAYKNSQALVNVFVNATDSSVPDEVLAEANELLEPLEGRQEDVMESLIGFEAILPDIYEVKKDDEAIINLDLAMKLVSTSIFIDLEQEVDNTIVTTGYLEQAAEDLIALFAEFFKNHSKPVNRSVMALVLGVVPVFFNRKEEISEYIHTSIENCGNKYELMATFDILKEIME